MQLCRKSANRVKIQTFKKESVEKETKEHLRGNDSFQFRHVKINFIIF